MNLSHIRFFLNTFQFIVFTFFFSSCHAQVIDYFNSIKKDPNALYAFFKAMPKGGELHYHLAGGAYPETMLLLASKGSYCLNKTTFVASSETACKDLSINELFNRPQLYSKLIRAWSFKNFIPGKESPEEHFFNAFSKFISIVFNYRPQLIAEVMKTAAQQHELYLELMDMPDNGNSLNFVSLIKKTQSNEQKRTILLANKEFQKNIDDAVSTTDKMLSQAYDELGCEKNPKNKSCPITVKVLYYTLREQPIDRVFVQALTAFEAVSRSKGNLVGVNLVQQEDGIIALRDYRKQMAVFNYLHQIYPKVRIALHAGELAPSSVTPEEIRYHIQDALFTGQAQRIGHGVAIAYEDNVDNSLSYMASHHIPVEINLISNLKILNISGPNHPLNYYLANKVPVVLSTDDEGILRTDLTHQYVEAVIAHGLNYSTLKQINRNALTYAFLPGTSIWTDANKNVLVSECQDLDSSSCQDFLKKNHKAQLQWKLEQKLKVFESNF